MLFLINLINGQIRIKVDSFKKSCDYFGITYIESNYKLKPLDPYFAGLIDTDGYIVFNYKSNRIECNLELKYNNYTKKLNFEDVIPNYKPSILLRSKIITNIKDKKYKSGAKGSGLYVLRHKSIAFKYQTVDGMIHLYNAFMIIRLYCDFKFYRISKIKEFIKIRSYSKYPKESLEFKIYSNLI